MPLREVRAFAVEFIGAVLFVLAMVCAFPVLTLGLWDLMG